MRLCIGRVARAHGLRGEIEIGLFRPRRGRSRRSCASDGAIAIVSDSEERNATLRTVRWIDDRTVVVAVADLVDRTAAEALQGSFVYAESEALPAALTDDADPCVGALVVDGSNDAALGTVSRIDDNGAQPLLVVRDASEREFAIPFVAALVEVTRAGARAELRVQLPEGLIELNRD